MARSTEKLVNEVRPMTESLEDTVKRKHHISTQNLSLVEMINPMFLIFCHSTRTRKQSIRQVM